MTTTTKHLTETETLARLMDLYEEARASRDEATRRGDPVAWIGCDNYMADVTRMILALR